MNSSKAYEQTENHENLNIILVLLNVYMYMCI